MGIANDIRKLDPPLKGNSLNNNNNNDSNIHDKGGGGNDGSNTNIDITNSSNGNNDGGGDLSGVRWRVGRVVRKIDSERRLVILRGYARAENGRLHPVQIRAMIDSGAQTEFISPDLARRLGGKITEGQFGVAVEAFGGETALTQQARDIELRLPGTNPRSLLAQDFLTHWDFIVSPHSLSSDYDLLLGTRFIRRFRLNLTFHEPCVIRLTAENGSETMITEELEEHIEQERESPSRQVNGAAILQQVQKSATIRPPTQSQRRAIRRDWRESEEWRMQQAARAAQDPTTRDSIMTMKELEDLWSKSKPGSVKIFMIQSGGWVEKQTATKDNGSSQSPIRVSAVGVDDKDSDGSLLPPEERERAANIVQGLQKEFIDVFPDELPAGVPPSRDSQPFNIHLKEGTRPFGRYGPRMTEENTQTAGKMIKELLAKGFIRPSRSPWGSPMFLVDKPDGSKRMVIDYRALNAATTRNRYPLPRVDELFDQLQGAKYFSKLDLRTGYWQIRVAAEDVPKTAFTSRHGHFEWLVLPMGLTNAPAEFMALMENTFRSELNKFVLVFLDDILVYSRTLEEHQEHLRVVLQRLREQKLFAKLSKCCFFRQEVEFLGHFVGRAGVRMVEGKVAAVERWPTPTTQKEVEQFIGLAGYYRRFIADFSKIASPLSELCGTLKASKGGSQRTPPKKRFEWGEQQQKAFEQLKTAVVSAPCLAIPDSKREFIVHTDASGYATGAVLMQQFDEGLRPIAFLSKKMTKAERNYPVHEQELLAILNALKAWRHYLGGRRFSVLTDHQSLQYVETSAMATPRQVRWAAWLSEFDFSIKYSPGKNNLAADALSRAAAGSQRVEADPEQQQQINSLNQRDSRLLVNAINELAPLPVRIRLAAAADADYQSTLQLPRDVLESRKLMRQGDLLYRDEGQLVVPNSPVLRTWLLSSAHDTLLGGHHSAAATAAWLGERVWWLNMAKAAQDYVRGCEQCQRNKPDQRGKQGLPLSIQTPEGAWEVWCMDFIGPLPRTARGHDVILVVVDKLTRWVYYIPTRQTASAQDTFALLDRFVLANHDTPKQIISDRDTRFTSHFWEDLWSAMRTQLKRSTSFHPQTDGQTERANRTLIEQLRSHVDEHQADWDILLPQLQRANNSAVCFSTGFSPFEMNYGRKLRTELDAELEADGVAAARAVYPGAIELAEQRSRVESEAKERIKKSQEKQRKDAQRGRRAGEIIVGDKVWLSNRNMRLDEQGRARKLESLYFGPYEVLEMHGSNAARIQLPPGCKLHSVFNLDLLRRFVDGKVEFPERPLRNNRPGPIPEEDPAAGGPAAAAAGVDDELEYEVEAIIGSRGRGVRQSYRVKWLGWPIEQSSWRPAAECRETCPDRVREYEQNQQQRRRAVHIIRTIEEQKSERRLQWSLDRMSAGQQQQAATIIQPQPLSLINSSIPVHSTNKFHAAAASLPSRSSLAATMQAKANDGGSDIKPAKRSQQDKEKHAGSWSKCMKTMEINENKEATSNGCNEIEQRGELQEQCRGGHALAKVEEVYDDSALPLPSPLVQNTSMKPSIINKSCSSVNSSRRSWLEVAIVGASSMEKMKSLEAMRCRRVTFAVDIPSSKNLQRKSIKTITQRHTEDVVSRGHAAGAKLAQDGGVMESHGVAAGGIKQRISMLSLSPWIHAEEARKKTVPATDISSHARCGSTTVQREDSLTAGVHKEHPDQMEEQCMGTLIAVSKDAGAKDMPAVHNNRSQQKNQISTSDGRVVSTSSSAVGASDRKIAAVEHHGSLCQSFPMVMHPPTPHIGPPRMWSDTRIGHQGLPSTCTETLIP